jgi:hypothetical protein
MKSFGRRRSRAALLLALMGAVLAGCAQPSGWVDAALLATPADSGAVLVSNAGNGGN